MTLDERPYNYCFTKNEIRYVFTLADLDRAGLFFQAKILYAAIGSSDFTELPVFELLPDSDGKIYLYIQQYINSLTKYVMPTFDVTVTNAEEQCVQFYIHYREITDEEPDGPWTEDEEDNIRIGIKGGIERHKNSRNNFFINYLDENQPFLTWQPTNRFAFANEPVCFSFLNKNGLTIKTGSKLRVVGYYADATTTDTLGEPIDYFMAHVAPFSLGQNFNPNADNKLIYFEVSIMESDGTTLLINPFRVYAHYRPVYDVYYLVYNNSIGGIDWAMIYTDTAISMLRNLTEADSGIALNDWNSSIKPPDNFYSSIVFKRVYKGNIGNVHTPNWKRKEAFTELFISSFVHMLIDGRWVPVTTPQETIDTGLKTSLKDGVPIEWRLSENNEVFTPVDKTFGEGSL